MSETRRSSVWSIIDSARPASRSIQYWGVPLDRLFGDFLEKGIENGVAGFRRVDEVERIEIRVDARKERELRQHRAGDGAVQIPAGNLVEIAVLLVEEHQDELLGQA